MFSSIFIHYGYDLTEISCCTFLLNFFAGSQAQPKQRLLPAHPVAACTQGKLKAAAQSWLQMQPVFLQQAPRNPADICHLRNAVAAALNACIFQCGPVSSAQPQSSIALPQVSVSALSVCTESPVVFPQPCHDSVMLNTKQASLSPISVGSSARFQHPCQILPKPMANIYSQSSPQLAGLVPTRSTETHMPLSQGMSAGGFDPTVAAEQMFQEGQLDRLFDSLGRGPVDVTVTSLSPSSSHIRTAGTKSHQYYPVSSNPQCGDGFNVVPLRTPGYLRRLVNNQPQHDCAASNLYSCQPLSAAAAAAAEAVDTAAASMAIPSNRRNVAMAMASSYYPGDLQPGLGYPACTAYGNALPAALRNARAAVDGSSSYPNPPDPNGLKYVSVSMKNQSTIEYRSQNEASVPAQTPPTMSALLQRKL